MWQEHITFQPEKCANMNVILVVQTKYNIISGFMLRHRSANILDHRIYKRSRQMINVLWPPHTLCNQKLLVTLFLSNHCLDEKLRSWQMLKDTYPLHLSDIYFIILKLLQVKRTSSGKSSDASEAVCTNAVYGAGG